MIIKLHGRDYNLAAVVDALRGESDFKENCVFSTLDFLSALVRGVQYPARSSASPSRDLEFAWIVKREKRRPKRVRLLNLDLDVYEEHRELLDWLMQDGVCSYEL